MAKSDLPARSIYHRKQDSIHAHLTVVVAAMVVGHVVEQASELSVKRLVRTLKRYRTFTLEVAGQTAHAASPVPAKVVTVLLDDADLPAFRAYTVSPISVLQRFCRSRAAHLRRWHRHGTNPRPLRLRQRTGPPMDRPSPTASLYLA